MQGKSEILLKITKKHFPSIRVTYKSQNTLLSQLTHVKPKSDISLKNVTYKISCQDCDGIYIEETLRNAQTRVKEHKAKLKHMQDEQDNNHNKIALHAQKHNHNIDFDGTEILAHESNYRKRKTKEAAAMLSHNNTFSKPSATINPIWHQLIKEHGKEYFKVKSKLPQTAPNIKKATRATATQPFNNQFPPHPPNAAATHAGQTAVRRSQRRSRPHTHTPSVQENPMQRPTPDARSKIPFPRGRRKHISHTHTNCITQYNQKKPPTLLNTKSGKSLSLYWFPTKQVKISFQLHSLTHTCI
jgi:hypothetical protein